MTDKELEKALQDKQKREQERINALATLCMEEVQAVLDKHGCMIGVQITAYYDPKTGLTQHGGQPMIHVKPSE